MVLPGQLGFGRVGKNLVVVHQNGHHAVDRRAAAGGSHACAAYELGLPGVRADVNAAHILAGFVLNSVPFYVRRDFAVPQVGDDFVVLHHGHAGHAHRRAGAGGSDITRHVHQQVFQMGFHDSIVARQDPNLIPHEGLDLAAFHQHSHVAAHRRTVHAASGRQACQNLGVPAGGLDHRVAAAGDPAPVLHVHQRFPV